MTAPASPETTTSWPDHTQLPCSDGTFVKNSQEHPQSVLLTDSIEPVLKKRHPDGRFAIGQDTGIYWRLADRPQDGAESPDWFYVPDVPALLGGQVRRSYVMWQEWVAPLIILEFVSGDGSEERDRTPVTGKFWVYEQVIRPGFYGIYEVNPGRIEMYHHVENHFELMAANARGHFEIAPLGVELGIWQGSYLGMELPWMRWFDGQGNLLLTGHELVAQEQQRTERLVAQERQRGERMVEQERERAERLAAQLRALGVDPDKT
ncbi:MAG: Uma2 family endonuclease [Gemmataceae bacterium]|nr:Uma2 family endonuclease [Gemmataceae bacterium]